MPTCQYPFSAAYESHLLLMIAGMSDFMLLKCFSSQNAAQFSIQIFKLMILFRRKEKGWMHISTSTALKIHGKAELIRNSLQSALNQLRVLLEYKKLPGKFKCDETKRIPFSKM